MSKPEKLTPVYLEKLNQELSLARFKSQKSEDPRRLSNDVKKRQDENRERDYSINGEYFYNRKLQNEDFEMLKALYKKTVRNFFVVNSAVKDIIYHWPERRESINQIIHEEKEKLDIGGDNSYANKLYRYMTDGETVNQEKKDDLLFREMSLPRRYSHESDIERDPVFETPFPSRKMKKRQP